MVIEEALKKAFEAGVSLTFGGDGSGRAYKIPSPNVVLFTWRGLPSFPAEFVQWDRESNWSDAKKKFANGLRVNITQGGRAGEFGVVASHDNSDKTILIKLSTNGNYWVRAEDITLAPHEFKLKDDVLITSEEGQKGLIVKIKNQDEILVYDFDSDDTYWYDHTELAPA